MTFPITEKDYIINTYMHIFGSILMIVVMSSFFDETKLVETSMTANRLIAIILLTFLSITAIVLTDTKNYFVKYAALFIFLLTISVPTYHIYKAAKESKILYMVLISLGIIVLSLSFIAYTQPLDIFNEWYPYLFIGLTSLVVIQLLDIIFTDTVETRDKIYGWLSIILFSGWIMYDTNKIRQIAKIVVSKCQNKSQIGCVDYVSDSMSMFLDILNVFSSLVRILRN